MSTVHRWSLGRFLVVLALLALAGPTASRAADFQADLDALYYHDGAGRTLNWDLTSGAADAQGVVTIPSAAYTLPPAETGAVLTVAPSGLTTHTFDSSGSGVYHMAIPPAQPGVPQIPTAASTITVDGSPDDWSSVPVYIQGGNEEAGVTIPSGAHVEYVKLAYRADQKRLCILYKLTETANTSVMYRLFLDKNLDRETRGTTDFQIDLMRTGSQWSVIGSGWHSNDFSDYYFPSDPNAVVVVSDQYLEAAVSTSVYGLPAKVMISGQTMMNADPYTKYVQLAAPDRDTEGYVYLNGDQHITVAAPKTWTAAARIQGFANWAFEDTCPYLRMAGAFLSGSGEDTAVQPRLDALWITGDMDGTELNNALVIAATIEKGGDTGSYQWNWDPANNDGGVILTDLDPSTTVVDLKLDITNNGQTVTFYYRTNSTSALNAGTWTTAVAKTLPAGTGTMYGAPTVGPRVGLQANFNRTAPVYRFWNKIYSRHIYTISRTEKAKLLGLPYFLDYEGIQYYTFAEDGHAGVLPIYRFWSDSKSAHFYTISEGEKNKLITKFASVWTYEGPVFYAYPEGSQPEGAVAVYRFWSDSLNCHFYTTNTAERDKLINKFSNVWTYEGIAFYTRPALFNDD